jgi:hypothetical protein
LIKTSEARYSRDSGRLAKIDIEQIAEPAHRRQPAMAGQFRARGRHTGDDRGDDRRAHDAVDTQSIEQSFELEFAHRRYSHMFDPNRSGLNQCQTLRIDFGIGRRRSRSVHWRGRRRTSTGADQSGHAVLRQTLDVLGNLEQGILPGQQLLNACAQLRPALLGQREMAPEIEQGDLAHLAAHAPALDQPVGRVGFPRGGIARLGSADEHAPERSA